jgi:hypothetical protein
MSSYCSSLLSDAGINVLSGYFEFVLSQQDDYVLTREIILQTIIIDRYALKNIQALISYNCRSVTTLMVLFIRYN